MCAGKLWLFFSSGMIMLNPSFNWDDDSFPTDSGKIQVMFQSASTRITQSRSAEFWSPALVFQQPRRTKKWQSVGQYHVSIGWQKRNILTGNHRFSHEDHGIFLYVFPQTNQLNVTSCYPLVNVNSVCDIENGPVDMMNLSVPHGFPSNSMCFLVECP